MSREQQIINERLRKIKELKDQGINPYPNKFDKKQSCLECSKAKLGTKVKTAGRLMTKRELGKISFANLRDSSGEIQIVFQEGETPEKAMNFFKNYIDSGDFVGVEGKIFRTKTKQISILVKKLELLTKSILPLPEKFHGLQDKEERYRKRYLDLIMNPEIKEVFLKRQLIFDYVREFLRNEGFSEVQTPILQPIYGGTNAKPFESKLNALDMKVYMRISNEMYLKRLIGGGYEKIFEFSPDFRNEGIDKLHNPEFTQVETMWGYASYKDNMILWPRLIEYVVKKIYGKTKIKIGKNEINFKTPWKKIKFLEVIKEHAKINFIDVKTLGDAKKKAELIGVDAKKCRDIQEVMVNVFEEHVQPKLIQPTLVYDYPKELVVLAKSEGDFAKSFEVIINGWEIALSYCEENDPYALAKKWKEQEMKLKEGDEESQRNDEDFLNMLRIGMPPVSGVGMGMDRLVMLLTNSASIRDVIMFPFMKI
ncbi:MAG: lysine--tRNA ligase [Nanoarchaeota archaeon]|nr:lysine--tRNA ligase [Nanoarchaeota archaeon]